MAVFDLNQHVCWIWYNISISIFLYMASVTRYQVLYIIEELIIMILHHIRYIVLAFIYLALDIIFILASLSCLLNLNQMFSFLVSVVVGRIQRLEIFVANCLIFVKTNKLHRFFRKILNLNTCVWGYYVKSKIWFALSELSL